MRKINLEKLPPLTLINKWRALLKDKNFMTSLNIGIIYFFISFYITIISSQYVDSLPVTPVSDFILDRIGPINLDIVFTYGAYIVFLTMIFYGVAVEPKSIPFALKSFALFFIIRSIFITLTHIGVPVDHIRVEEKYPTINIIRNFFYSNDLFFSAHTGAPFLGFLIVRQRIIKIFLFLSSLVLAFTVLAMHLHYSIDVFAAYFITYGIYNLSGKFFPRAKNIRDKAYKLEKIFPLHKKYE